MDQRTTTQREEEEEGVRKEEGGWKFRRREDSARGWGGDVAHCQRLGDRSREQEDEAEAREGANSTGGRQGAAASQRAVGEGGEKLRAKLRLACAVSHVPCVACAVCAL